APTARHPPHQCACPASPRFAPAPALRADRHTAQKSPQQPAHPRPPAAPQAHANQWATPQKNLSRIPGHCPAEIGSTSSNKTHEPQWAFTPQESKSWLTSLQPPVLAASIPTASPSAPSTPSARASKCSTSIPTCAFAAPCASPSAPWQPSSTNPTSPKSTRT